MFGVRIGPPAAALAVVIVVSALAAPVAVAGTAADANTDASDARGTVEMSVDGGIARGGGDGTMVVAETSVTETFFRANAERATVEFDEPTTGAFAIEPVETFPAGVPAPEGEDLAIVEISTPDLAYERDPRVKITLPRELLEANEATAEGLRIVRVSGTNPPERLDTSVVRRGEETVTVVAETPGFSLFAVVQPDTTATPQPTATATATPEPTATPRPTATATPDPTPRATATDTPTVETTAGDGGGFGPVAALVALVGAGALAGRRRS
ncbi:hypothetical protein [Haloplanus pelagicus]|jgi:PGF-CTERM protein|uniref:hypothetical protein n=1 Tax=Haloplanus pelagicus TaxID=2949995 RepID=UPI00203FCF15|nr:hypothetical protein [Haloplanus sp. HW8-1]